MHLEHNKVPEFFEQTEHPAIPEAHVLQIVVSLYSLAPHAAVHVFKSTAIYFVHVTAQFNPSAKALESSNN